MVAHQEPFEGEFWELDEPLASGPCLSPEEAFARVAGEVSEFVTERRDKWWRYRWERSFRVPTEAMAAAAVAAGTTPQRLMVYLAVVADASNRSGTDPVYLLRSTIAERMGGCSVKTVERCRRAAVVLGFHSPGVQARWIDENKPGSNPWCGSSAAVVLTMPDRRLWPVSVKADRVADRTRRRRAAIHRRTLEAKHRRDAEHAERLEALIAAGQRQPAKQPVVVREKPQGLLAARAMLEANRGVP